jgi:hypothetical protein
MRKAKASNSVMSDSEPIMITLDGRSFQGIGQDLTAIQDDYITAQLRLADAFPIILRLNNKKEDPEACSQELLTNILERGLKYRILAGVLTEAGKPWTQEAAERNAESFSRIVSAAEKELMNAEVVALVLNFFLFATQSLRTSQNSSGPAAHAANPGASAGAASSATSA